MKFIKWIIGLAAIAAITLSTAAKAQTNIVSITTTNASGGTTTIVAPDTFFTSVENYFTGANTNFTWESNRLEIAAGGDYMGGQEWANYLSGQYDWGRWDAQAKVRNLGVAGTIESVEAGGGYALIQYYSFKLQVDLIGGYDFEKRAALIEPGATIRNKLTKNTFAELGVSEPIWLQKSINRIPDFRLGVGFTY
ncbi:MAG TPA: hypothetical protein VGO57_02245 [Verrucomicrobiae bacterium]|jgi:hypothetical protein